MGVRRTRISAALSSALAFGAVPGAATVPSGGFSSYCGTPMNVSVGAAKAPCERVGTSLHVLEHFEACMARERELDIGGVGAARGVECGIRG